MIAQPPRFNAIVLAADRGHDDPVAAAAGVPAKCLTPIAGKPMLLRVLQALVQSQQVGTILLCGPKAEILERSPELRQLLSDGAVQWIEQQATPSRSAAAALEALPAEQPVLLTTGDHALLSPGMVQYFLDRAGATTGCDVAFALAPHELVQSAYPRSRRTVLKFSDGNFCGCNLFAFLSPRGRGMAQLWQQVEDRRKTPIRVISLIGWRAMALYAMGWLSLKGALRRLSRKTGIRVGMVTMPFAEAAIDVDSVEDLNLVRNILARPD
ncbi:MAG: nucleotidyltransferase family protein [Rhodoferax sp.]|nr:nucleotidyltransferase family protein [Rhodoferax sp.]